MKKLVTILLAVLMLMAVAGCSSKPAEPTTTPTDTSETNEPAYTLVNPGYLTAACSTDYAPMEFIDLTKTGQEMYVGSDIELAKYLADQLGLELKVMSMEFDMAIASVNSGISDICISGLSYTSDRAASYLMTSSYYDAGDGGQVAVIAAADADKYTTLSSINNKDIHVAAQSGALQMEIAEEQLPDCDLAPVTNLDSAFDLLASGTYQAIISSQINAESRIAQSPEKFAIIPEAFDSSKYTGYHGLVKLGNEALFNAIEEIITNMPEGKYSTWLDEAEALLLNLGDNASETIIEEE